MVGNDGANGRDFPSFSIVQVIAAQTRVRTMHTFNMRNQNNTDFTVDEYCALLEIAKRSYTFVGYNDLPLSNKYILWRHDVDYSLNRSLRLAEVEHAAGVKATYFINPHSEFYSVLEKSQTQIIHKILSLGHAIGLHFDAEYYDITSEAELDALIQKETGYLQDWFGVTLSAFSFHNPTSFLLTCEKERYGGLINCYSRFFKSSVPYCSDSNGYWRFRRLRDVLESATDPHLQVLTHDGWWQETQMTPRERVYRSVNGRAEAIMRQYDQALIAHGRKNQGALSPEFQFLKEKLGRKAEFLDQLWMRGEFESTFIEIWRIFESQLVKYCRILARKTLNASAGEVDLIFDPNFLQLPLNRFLSVVHEESWDRISAAPEDMFLEWRYLRERLVHGTNAYSRMKIEQGMVFIINVMKHVLGYYETHLSRNCKRTQREIVERRCFIEWVQENADVLQLDKEKLTQLIRERKKEGRQEC